jgi:glyoxylase-like metal-dependent hydrolase (beta-lactamase superfamily II)
MQDCKIHPLPLCTLTINKGYFTYLVFPNYTQRVRFPVYSWLILSPEEPILVDVGCSINDFAKEVSTPKLLEEIAPEEISTIEESLAKFDYSTEDIKTIILTQLHVDHILNAKKFPNAKFIVQKEELEFALDPHPLYAQARCGDLCDELSFEIISGDTEIVPGVKVIATPGHTPGGQSVVVTTRQGNAVICGMCTIDENFAYGETIVIPGMISDPFKAYDSMVKIRETADIIIPLHSQRLLSTSSIP